MPASAPAHRRLLFASASLFAAACAWDPWIPGQRSWNPMPVVDPATLSHQLALDAPYVDELDCYSRRCQERFRIFVDRPGQLTVRALVNLPSQDDQARVVLESVQGVIGQAGSGRGAREDVAPLSVRQAVEPGTYFVLLQSVGGRTPYQLTATLTPDEGVAESEPEPVSEPERPLDPPARYTKLELGRNTSAGYDPAVRFSDLRSYRFAPIPRAGEDVPAGTRLEQPIDRQIRRLLDDALELKGFRQGAGDETADLVVAFSRGERSEVWPGLAVLYDRYEFGSPGRSFEVDTRGTLVVDIVETRSGRVAWHASTSRGLGPGITHGKATTALLRAAVADLLAGFPPH